MLAKCYVFEAQFLMGTEDLLACNQRLLISDLTSLYSTHLNLQLHPPQLSASRPSELSQNYVYKYLP